MGEPTELQSIVLYIVGFLSFSLSFIGSCAIIFMCLRRRNLGLCYHRLVFGLSVYDLILSSNTFTQVFLLPKETGAYMAIGNQMTCNVAAFFFQYYVAVAIYNLALSVYFLLNLKFGWKPIVIAKRVEWFFHLIAFVLPTSTAILGVSTEAFNPIEMPRICHFGYYPTGCDSDPDVECLRGLNTDSYKWIFIGQLFATSLLGICCTATVYFTVRRVFHNAIKYRLRRDRFGSAKSDDSTDSEIPDPFERRRRETGKQCVLYTLAYLNGFVWPATFGILGGQIEGDMSKRLGEPWLYTLTMLSFICMPLQGFLNFWIYIRPRLSSYRKLYPDMPFSKLLKEVVFGVNGSDKARRKGGVIADKESTLKHDIRSSAEGTAALGESKEFSCLSEKSYNSSAHSISCLDDDERNQLDIMQLKSIHEYPEDDVE